MKHTEAKLIRENVVFVTNGSVSKYYDIDTAESLEYNDIFNLPRATTLLKEDDEEFFILRFNHELRRLKQHEQAPYEKSKRKNEFKS